MMPLFVSIQPFQQQTTADLGDELHLGLGQSLVDALVLKPAPPLYPSILTILLSPLYKVLHNQIPPRTRFDLTSTDPEPVIPLLLSLSPCTGYFSGFTLTSKSYPPISLCTAWPPIICLHLQCIFLLPLCNLHSSNSDLLRVPQIHLHSMGDRAFNGYYPKI